MKNPAFVEAYQKRYRDECLPRAGQIEALRGAAAGQTVFCIGCGPSLLQQDPGLLRDKRVICTNVASEWVCDSGASVLASIVTDSGRLIELSGKLSSLDHPVVVCPTGFRHRAQAHMWFGLLRQHPLWIPLRGRGRFGFTMRGLPSFRPDEGIEHCGKSVIFAAMQLAVFTGAARVVLLGVDMDYSGARKHFTRVPQRVVSPDLYDRDARPMFEHFRNELASRGVELVNATEGGRVDVLRRVRLADVVEQWTS